MEFTSIEAIIFDLDGTLVSARERIYRVFCDTLRKFGLPVPDGEALMRKLAINEVDEFLKGVDAQAFWRVFLETYSSSYQELSEAFPGAKEALQILKQHGFKVGVITGRLCDPAEVRAELQRFGLESLVDVIVTKKLVVDRLQPEKFLWRSLEITLALKGLGTEPARALLVGDYILDIRSAQSVGMRSVAVLSGSCSREVLEKASPDAIIRSVAELPLLLGLAKGK